MYISKAQKRFSRIGLKINSGKDMFVLFLLLLFLAMPHSMWDFSSPIRDRTCAPCSGSESLNHWITREVLYYFFLIIIIFWLRWVFVAVHGLSLVAASEGYSLLWCAGFSLWWLLLLRSTGSRRVGFSSRGTWAQ